MKAVILAGGRGTRLNPLTLATNKHLFAVYDKPVIYYAIEKLVAAGIYQIMIVTSSEHIGDFVKLLGSGKNFVRPQGGQVQIVYGIQNEPNGIAYGLYIAKEYVGKDDFLLFLGDNIFEDDIALHIKSFKSGARVFLKKVPDPHRFGIATIDKKGKVIAIEEKPRKPKSDLAVTGLYLYDATVFDKMLDQQKSERGEYEVTYLNNKYLKEGKLDAVLLKKKWFDVGTFDSLLDASMHMRKKKRKLKH
ncbi:spore coat protein [Candidatus Kaiserbacteria bacterium]|nr:spore coat protein [Candidatus Kaiserbacteria bacterium]